MIQLHLGQMAVEKLDIEIRIAGMTRHVICLLAIEYLGHMSAVCFTPCSDRHNSAQLDGSKSGFYE